MIRKGMTTIAATWLALAASAAQAANATCLTPGEADAVSSVMAPGAIRAAAQRCAPVLPAPGLLDGRAEAFASRFDARAAAVMPQVQQAFSKLAGGASIPDPALVQPLMTGLIEEMVSSKITPQSCGVIDRGLKLLEPLPPRNLTGLIVLLAELAGNKGGKGFAICPGPGAGASPPLPGSGGKDSKPGLTPAPAPAEH